MTPLTLPELLAPAGDRASLEAAVHNGADAVYFGAKAFNARTRAGNFDAEGIRGAIDFAHLRGVRAYLALNTLLHDEELDDAVAVAANAYEAGIDAVIVQDLGLARRLRSSLYDLPLHASTQTTFHDADGIRAACALGFSRIILPRELSIPEIAALTGVAAEYGASTEVFVHGALCFCYSGQCRMSSLIGGRSGNRGECAQPCRLSYSLQTGGAVPREQPGQPLLGMKDLSALPLLPELAAAGVASCKIEGRMRSAEYVGQVVSVFRSRLDALAAADPTESSATREEDATDTRRLLQAFNRGGRFTDAYLRGAKDPSMMAGPHPGSHGLLLGPVLRALPSSGVLEISSESDDFPGPGDVLSVRDPATGEEKASAPCSPAAPTSSSLKNAVVAVKGFHPDVLRTIHSGDPVYRMTDTASEREAGTADRRRTPVLACFSKNDAGLFRLTVRVSSGLSAGATASATEDACRTDPVPPLEEGRLRDQLRRSGGTPFQVDEVQIEASPTLPVSAVNALRRQALDLLGETLPLRFRRTRPSLPVAPAAATHPRPVALSRSASAPARWAIAVEAYVFEGDADDLACGADAYYLPAVSWLSGPGLDGIHRLLRLEPGAAVFAVLPPASRGPFSGRLSDLPRLVAEEGGRGLVTGNPGLVARASAMGLDAVAGPDANLWNTEALSVYGAFGSRIVVPSVELGSTHTATLCRSAAELGLEAETVVYGRQRLMYSELCPVGLNRPGCTACRKGPVSLRDRTEALFPVVCIPEACSAAILNSSLLAVPREALAYRMSGANRLRLCFFDETPEERRRLTDLHRTLADVEGAERIRSVAAAVAARAGARLTRGPQ